jgi:hypothetical protein
MKTSLFLVSIFLGGSLFAQTAAKTDQSNSLLKKFNEEAKQHAEAPPISFMENKGQIHDQNDKPRPDVLFGAMAGNMAFHLKTTGVSYQLTRVNSYKEVEDPKTNLMRNEIDQQTIYRVDLSWLNANLNLRTTTDQTLEGFNNYYLENCPNGALNVKSYTGVTVHNLYNGINLHYYEKEGQLKHDYIVEPGVNYQQIQLKVEGATVRINDDGSLTLTTPLGKIIEDAPIVYQNGKQLNANWTLKNNTLGFEIENYNPNQELIIDPVTRLWGTYYGGTGIDYGYSCATDASGNVYMVGNTESNTGTVIATVGAHQTSNGGGFNAFLVKFNSSGVRQWATYYGGSGYNDGIGCSVDLNNNVFLAGTATSSEPALVTIGAHQTIQGGNSDAYLVKFNSAGVRQWGTYYGGTGNEGLNDCKTDAAGNVYITGYTTSSSGISIATVGSHQNSNGGTDDAYLVKFNSAGVRQWGTFYGGSGYEAGNGCSIDASGNIYLIGNTTSTSGTVIATAGSHQSLHGGSSYDAFLVKFNAAGVRQWGTYYGGNGDDVAGGFGASSIDVSGNIYFTGRSSTASGSAIATSGSHQENYGGGAFDAYLVKFNGAGVRQWGTYYGDLGFDNGISCSSDALGFVYVAGNTTSSASAIATAGDYQPTFGGGTNDAFLTKFNNAGVRQWGTYYGGSGSDTGISCTSDVNGNIYFSGYTDSNTGLDIATSGTHQASYGGGSYDAFLVKFLDCSGPTTATVSQTACDSYTWALNGTTYTTSGTYTHVGTNASGCPLTTTLNLTINNSTTATVTQTACDSYTWALNGTTYTTSGTYTHIGTNASGCPLTTTLNLTINNSTTATVNQTACDSYTWALNGTTYTASGTYTHVGTNASGCQLTTTLNLTINNSTTATVNQTACDSYTWALNGTTYTTSGTYTHVGTNASGCPLTTTLNLTINNSTTATVNQTACDSYTWALNGTTYTTSGTYSHVGTNASGCPLTTTLNLTINASTTATVNQTACISYTWALNGTTYTSSGTYTHVGTNAVGCQLTTTLNLTINTVNVATNLSGITITANASGASYQWIDCNNGNAIIPGAIAQAFTATTNGNYAVIVTDANCTDTSVCIAITSVGVDVHSSLVEIRLQPNPTFKDVTIVSNAEIIRVEIFTTAGELVQQELKHAFSIEDLSRGIYLVKVITSEGTSTLRLIKE